MLVTEENNLESKLEEVLYTEGDITDSIGSVIGLKVDKLPENHEVETEKGKGTTTLGYAIRGAYATHIATNHITDYREKLWVKTHEDVHNLTPLLLDPSRVELDLKSVFADLEYPLAEVNTVTQALNQEIAELNSRLIRFNLEKQKERAQERYEKEKDLVDQRITDPSLVLAKILNEIYKIDEIFKGEPSEEVKERAIKIEGPIRERKRLLEALNDPNVEVPLGAVRAIKEDKKYSDEVNNALERIDNYHEINLNIKRLLKTVHTYLNEGLTQYFTFKILEDIASKKGDRKLQEYVNAMRLDSDITTSLMLSNPVYEEIIRLICTEKDLLETIGELVHGKRVRDVYDNLTVYDVLEIAWNADEELSNKRRADELGIAKSIAEFRGRIGPYIPPSYEIYLKDKKELTEGEKAERGRKEKLAGMAFDLYELRHDARIEEHLERVEKRVKKLRESPEFTKDVDQLKNAGIPKAILAEFTGEEGLKDTYLSELMKHLNYDASRAILENVYQNPKELIQDLQTKNIYHIFRKIHPDFGLPQYKHIKPPEGLLTSTLLRALVQPEPEIKITDRMRETMSEAEIEELSGERYVLNFDNAVHSIIGEYCKNLERYQPDIRNREMKASVEVSPIWLKNNY